MPATTPPRHALALRRPTTLVVAVLLLALAACGSDDAGPDTTATTAPSAATAPSTTEPLTIEPVATAPASTDPAPTDPAPTEPASTDAPVASGLPTIEELLTLGRPIVLAHAAGEDQHPHSTMFGYAESAAAGVDMLDLDVQLTGDGVLVVQHDGTVDRTTNGTGDVAAMTYDELFALDNAYWFTADCTCQGQPDTAYLYRGIRTGERPAPAGYGPDDFAIPRFEDVIERFPDLPVNIEVKGEGAPAIAAATELVRILTEHDLLDHAVIGSFDDTVIDAVHDLAPEIEISPGLAAATAWVLDDSPLPYGMRILQLPPRYGDIEVLTDEVITRAHAAGYAIWVWPNDRALENLDSYTAFLEQGMDGLNANFPATAVEAVRAFAG